MAIGDFDEFQKSTQNKVAGGSCHFCSDLQIASLATWRRQGGSRGAFSWFLSFSLGRCWKNEKNRILAGEVSQSVKIALPRWVGIKKKNDSHVAWECQNWFLRHLSSENVNFGEPLIFGCCNCCLILGGQKVCKMGRPVWICILITFWWILWQAQKSKMLLKPLVGARILNEDDAKTEGTIWDVIVFLGRETELCKNRYGFQRRMNGGGTGGSTIIFF